MPINSVALRLSSPCPSPLFLLYLLLPLHPLLIPFIFLLVLFLLLLLLLLFLLLLLLLLLLILLFLFLIPSITVPGRKTLKWVGSMNSDIMFGNMYAQYYAHENNRWASFIINDELEEVRSSYRCRYMMIMLTLFV